MEQMTYITGATATHLDIPIAIPSPRICSCGKSDGTAEVKPIPAAKAGDALPKIATIDTIEANALPTNLDV
jgi:hypothetical protein